MMTFRKDCHNAKTITNNANKAALQNFIIEFWVKKCSLILKGIQTNPGWGAKRS